MMLECLQVFDAATVDESAYTEIVVDTSHFAIEAVIGRHNGGYGAQQSIKNTFGLSEAQLPLLDFGPGLKTRGPLFV